jgi:hypothetical protein
MVQLRLNRKGQGQRARQNCASGNVGVETIAGEVERNAGVAVVDFDDVEEELEATQNGGLIEMGQPEPREMQQMPEESSDDEDEEQIPA